MRERGILETVGVVLEPDEPQAAVDLRRRGPVGEGIEHPQEEGNDDDHRECQKYRRKEQPEDQRVFLFDVHVPSSMGVQYETEVPYCTFYLVIFYLR